MKFNTKKLLSIIFIFILSFFIINNTFAGDTDSSSGTTQEEEKKDLVLNGIEVVDKNVVELTFGSEIKDSDDKDIIVRLLGDDPKEIFVLDFIIEKNVVKLVLEEELESNKDYEVIIFSLTGKDGSTITSGIDGAIKFNSGDITRFDKQEDSNEEDNVSSYSGSEVNVSNTQNENIIENNDSNGNNNIEDQEVILNSAGESNNNLGSEGTNYDEKNSTLNGEKIGSEGVNEQGTNGVDENGTEGINNNIEENNKNLGGQQVDEKEVEKNIEVAAGKKKELVKTGPEHILLFVLAMMLASLVFYTFRTRKI